MTKTNLEKSLVEMVRSLDCQERGEREQARMHRENAALYLRRAAVKARATVKRLVVEEVK